MGGRRESSGASEFMYRLVYMAEVCLGRGFGIWEESEKFYLNSSYLQNVLFLLLRLRTRAH